jgi:dsDNA-specific endonuclease/ATPase MutS2
MTLDFLLKAIRRMRLSGQQNTTGGVPKEATRDEHPEADDPCDLEAPFDEPVVVELRDVIDLHSIPPAQIPAVVKDYLEEAHLKGFRWVRIIHGKGVGVQRAVVRSILSSSELVADFHDAPPEAGGLGATVAMLRETEKQLQNEN